MAGLIVFGVVLVAAFIGIGSRMSELLASFWPANAVLLGCLVRWPVLARWTAWPAAVAAYLVADVTTRATLSVTLGLTAANLAGVLVGWVILRRWQVSALCLEHPRDVVRLVIALAAASGAATVVGIPVGVLAFDLSVLEAGQIWFTAELTAYVAVMPVILTARAVHRPIIDTGWRTAWGPLAVFVVLLTLGVTIGGPIALTVFLPILAWTAMRGAVFLTSALVLVATVWNLLALGSGLLKLDFHTLAVTNQVALQCGLTLVTVGPLLLAVSIRARERDLQQVQQLARHDPLTGLFNRRAFEASAQRVVDRAVHDHSPVSVIMLDIDRFKAINDEHGHLAGDAVLEAVGGALAETVRPGDVVARFGGEEFAVVAAGLDVIDAHALAERLRSAVADARPEGLEQLRVTASAGVACLVPDESTTVAMLVASADSLLYEAKRSGRNTTRAGLPAEGPSADA